MLFQILDDGPTSKMTRWTMIKWIFGSIAFLLTVLLLSAIITLWNQPNASDVESAVPKTQSFKSADEPVSLYAAKRKSF